MIQLAGGSGFIGSRLVGLFSKEKFQIFDKNPSLAFPDKVNLGDVRDVVALRQHLAGAGVVLLLAAEHRDDVVPTSLYYEVNVEGARNVVQVMREHNIRRLIFTSTVAVYGLNRESPQETDKVSPFGDYGQSKWEAEEVLRGWWHEAPDERELVIVRPCVVFGEKNRGNVYNLLKQIHSGHFLMIGPGRNYKSMAYVGNVAAFLKHLLDHPKVGYRLYNYVDKPDFNMNDLVQLVRQALPVKSASSTLMRRIRLPYDLGMWAGHSCDVLAKVTGRQFPISAVRVQKFCATTQFSATNIQETEFIPPYSLKQGLEKTLAYEFK
ncbi:MAG: NAD-dependent epimerase/dehydratase family protein [bacterium]